MKLALVVQRYGAEIAGGSEGHCRQLAIRLSSRHDVTVLTTCARDYVTWANAYPEGRSADGQVAVHRFRVARPRQLAAFREISDEVFEGAAPPEREDAWFRENGPDAPGLLDFLRARGSDFDVVAFWTYRYAPSYFGLPLVSDRAVLVPTAEEDPAIRLGVLREFFTKPAGYLFLTPEEAHLVSSRASRPIEHSAVIGVGLEPAPAAPPRTDLDALGLPPDYLLYLGRVDRNKGCDTLFAYFLEHTLQHPDATLVLAGPSKMQVPAHPQIRALGYVSDRLRDALLAHAGVIVVPSPYESLSMVLLEAWNCAVPALVNGGCKVLAGQVVRGNGGLVYRSGAEFDAALDYFRTHPRERTTLGAQGRAYVEQEYRWPTVVARVEGLLAEVMSRRSGSPSR